MTTASVHVTAFVVRNSCSAGSKPQLEHCQVTMADLLTGMQPQQQQSMCGPPPSGLLMVYAVPTLAVKVWLCRV